MLNFEINKYNYTQRWFINTEIRKNLLNYIQKDKKINMLEIGTFEGLSTCCFSDNLMEHQESTLDCVDPFILSGTEPRITTENINTDTEKIFLKNIKSSKNYKKITFHKMESDNFFKSNKKKFNLIYVDGCHEEEFIKNDINNAFTVLEKGGILWLDDYCGGGPGQPCKKYMNNALEKYNNQYKIIHIGYQLAIKKI